MVSLFATVLSVCLCAPAAGDEQWNFDSSYSSAEPVAYLADEGCEPGCDVPYDCCGEYACSDAGCGDDCAPCGSGSAKPDPCASAFKGVFYDNDFGYLN